MTLKDKGPEEINLLFEILLQVLYIYVLIANSY